MQRLKSLVRDPVKRELAKETLFILGSTFMFTKCMYNFRDCQGASMLPTLSKDREWVLVDRLSYYVQNKSYNMEDVVVSISKDDPSKTVCKRVTGVAGDTILYMDYNSNTLLSHVVGTGQVWLTGDNPLDSKDSRQYGPVPLGLLEGRVLFKMWFSPPHFNRINYVRDADKIVQSPIHYLTKSYNISRMDGLQAKDWEFLYKRLKDDKCCVNMSPFERAKHLRRAEQMLKSLSARSPPSVANPGAS